MTVLRRAYVPVEPDVENFDDSLKAKLKAQDPGGKAGKQIGGQLNRALKRFDLDTIDVKADPKKALAAIGLAETKLRELSRNAETVEVKVRTDQALRQVERFRKQLGDIGEDAGPEAATGFAARFGARLGPLIANLPISGPLGVALGGAAIAAAPLVGAAISGAILGGVGIGGVVGGLVVASKDARVKAAIDDLGEDLQNRLFSAGAAFVQPALKGIAEISDAVDTVDIEGIFRNASRFVPVLTAGVSSALTDLGDGIESLVRNAGPAVVAISDGLAQVGESVSDGLQSLSDNGPEAAAALRTVFDVIDSSLTNTFRLVDALTELYAINQKIGGDTGLRLALKLTGAEMDKTAESGRRLGSGTFGVSDAMNVQIDYAKELTAAQKAVTDSQNDLQSSMNRIAGGSSKAALTADSLRSAMDKLYGATIRQDDANQSYEASWDGLSASVKANKRSLDVHTESGRANRDALKALITSTNDAYIADVNAGVAIDKARQKHRNRIEAIKEESKRLNLNKGATKDLIDTYGQIPKKKQTDLILGKVGGIVKALENLYITQRAIAEGIPLASARAAVKEKGGPAKLFGGFATGGLFDGRLPGAPSSVDNLRGRGPNGRQFGLAGGEFIVNAAQTSKHRGVLEAINAGLDGFAAGGYFPPVDTSTRIPIRTDVSKAFVMTLAQAKAAVTPALPTGGGPTSDFIVAAARALVPNIRVLSKDRPGARTLSGNVSYHARNRAVDFEASEKLARLWNQNYKARTKELISPYQRYNIHNGERHTYTGAVWNQHNFAGGNPHDHIAMAGGGVIGEPVYGVGKSGRSYSFGERGPETVTPGVGAGEVHVHFHNSVITSERQAVAMVTKAYKTAVYERKIP